MSKGDRDGFVVKFVDVNGRKTDLAVKAYEVSTTLIAIPVPLL